MLKAWPKTAGAGNPWKTTDPVGVFQQVPGSAEADFWLGRNDRSDNSNTQFALLALWAARRYDLPLDPVLRLVAKRFRSSQEADGEWQYMVDRAQVNPPLPTMTAAGLLGLAVGYGLDDDTKVSMTTDPVLQNGIKRLAQNIGNPGDNIDQPHPPCISCGRSSASRSSISRPRLTARIGTTGAWKS